MDGQYEAIFSRNIGLLTESEQRILKESTIAIAGMGGVGGLLAERLIRMGVGRLKILDPGAFKQSDLNRQFGSSILNLGQNKAEAVFAQVSKINPEAQIDYSPTGINNENNAALFVSDSDLVIDEMDIGSFRESIILQRAARRRGIHYLFSGAIGFGALVVIFDPQGLTLEEYNKLSPDLDLSDNCQVILPAERVLPIFPSYAGRTTVDVIQEITKGERPAPAISIGVALASVLAASEAVNIILRKRDVVKAPQYTYIDLLDRKFIVQAVS